MERSVRLDNRGLTLVEIMIALTLLLLVSMAMMQTALVGIGANMQNVLRDEAVRIAETRMHDARNLQFDQLVSDTADTIPDEAFAMASCPAQPANYPVVIEGNFKNMAPVRFGTIRTVNDLDGDHKQVTVLVRWEYRNTCYSHQVDALISS